MSKELDAFNKIKSTTYWDDVPTMYFPKECQIVEKALKDYYELKDRLGITDVTKADYFKMFDQSRAFEIIKNKRVDLSCILDLFAVNLGVETYNFMISSHKMQMATFPPCKLTEEEYELLKEMLYVQEEKNRT